MQETQETWVRILGREDHLEEEMAIHSSILVWRIPWTGEPGGLPSMGSQRIGHNLSNIACTRNSYRFARGKFWLYVKQNWFEKALIKVFVFITSLLFLFGEYEPIFLKGEIKKNYKTMLLFSHSVMSL